MALDRRSGRTRANIALVNTLAQFTSRRLLATPLAADDAHGAIAELAGRLHADGLLPDPARFLAAVIKRERVCPTVCSPGWALPHARLPDLPRLSFALGRTDRPIAWPSQPRLDVTLVWLFAVPESETKPYLGLIGAVARLNQNPGLSQALQTAPDPLALETILAQVPFPASPLHSRATTSAC